MNNYSQHCCNIIDGKLLLFSTNLQNTNQHEQFPNKDNDHHDDNDIFELHQPQSTIQQIDYDVHDDKQNEETPQIHTLVNKSSHGQAHNNKNVNDNNDKLNVRQKEELQRYVQCLDSDHLNAMKQMLQSFIPESQGDNNMDEIDLDAVDDSIQVKMYACMLKAKHQQETERRRRGIDDNHNEKKISDESDKQRVLKEKESNDTKNNNTKVINDNLGKSDYDLHPKLYRVEDPFNSEEYYERYDAEDDNTKFNEKHLKYINLSRMNYWIDWDEDNNRGNKTQHFAFMDYSYIKCRAKRGSGAKSRPTLFGLYIKGILFEDTKEKYFGSFRINTDRLNEEGAGLCVHRVVGEAEHTGDLGKAPKPEARPILLGFEPQQAVLVRGLSKEKVLQRRIRTSEKRENII